jgi:hypothetical protein
MKTDTSNKIVEYVKSHARVRPHELVMELGLSPVAIHKQLKHLVVAGILSKIGKPPLVYYHYTIDLDLLKQSISRVDKDEPKIEETYLYISPSGEFLDGMEGFMRWVRDTKQETQFPQLVSEYVKTRDSADKQFTSFGWIDATHKIVTTFKEVSIDAMLYQDFFALPKFGKTKLGQMVLYGKQGNQQLVRDVIRLVKPITDRIIHHYKIDAVSFLPPTVPRPVQYMKELAGGLKINLPEVKLDKIFTGPVRIPQKSIPKLEQRVVNARSTIYPTKMRTSYSRILLIDDAVGSGATFNETGKKLRQDGIAKDKIFAFAIVGSMKGFDVLSEL